MRLKTVASRCAQSARFKAACEIFSKRSSTTNAFATAVRAARAQAGVSDLCGNQISEAPRHRRDVVPVTRPNSLVDFHTVSNVISVDVTEGPPSACSHASQSNKTRRCAREPRSIDLARDRTAAPPIFKRRSLAADEADAGSAAADGEASAAAAADGAPAASTAIVVRRTSGVDR